MSFDPKCYDLAEHFLLDQWDEVPTAMKDELAQAIQDTIEDYFFDRAGKDAPDQTTGQPA
jgi:hypothetical protein